MAAWLLLTRDVAHCRLLKYSIDFGKKDQTFLRKLKVCSSVLPIVVMFPPEGIYILPQSIWMEACSEELVSPILNIFPSSHRGLIHNITRCDQSDLSRRKSRRFGPTLPLRTKRTSRPCRFAGCVDIIPTGLRRTRRSQTRPYPRTRDNIWHADAWSTEPERPCS